MKLHCTLLFFGVIVFGWDKAMAQYPDETPTSEKPRLIVQTGHSKMVSCLAFSPDGKLLATGSKDATIQIYQVFTGYLLRAFPARAQAESLSFTPDGSTLVSTSGAGVDLWDVKTGQRKELDPLPIRGLIGTIAISPDWKYLAIGTYGTYQSFLGDEFALLYDFKSGKLTYQPIFRTPFGGFRDFPES